VIAFIPVALLLGWFLVNFWLAMASCQEAQEELSDDRDFCDSRRPAASVPDPRGALTESKQLPEASNFLRAGGEIKPERKPKP